MVQVAYRSPIIGIDLFAASAVSKAPVHFADQKCKTYERSYPTKAACIIYPKLSLPQVRRASALKSELEIYNDKVWSLRFQVKRHHQPRA